MDKSLKKRPEYLEIQKYRNYKAIFKIADNDVLDLFEKLLDKSSNFLLEPSFKIENENFFPARFIVSYYFNEGFIKNIDPIFKFFQQLSKINTKLNYNPVRRININKINFKKIEEVMVGVDLRNNFNKSRVKFWLAIDGYPELFNQILKTHGYNKKVSDLIYSSTIIVGFDFYFNGKTKIKIYIRLDSSHLNNEIIQKKLNKIFSRKINNFISKCDKVFISYKGRNFKRVLYFYPKNSASFIRLLNNKKLNGICSKADLLNKDHCCAIALMENEINKNSLRNINFYYS